MSAITEALLAWYAAARRDLPWRHTSDPYCIWVSEVMLQQTQVATVIPYYERFIARFPTIRALASASLDELLALWQGLGYYARARNLHRAARLICEQCGGELPADVSALRALPGIGEYTAAALASIAYGRDEVAMDGNVMRVLCRLTDEERSPIAPRVKAVLRDYALALLPPGRAGSFNQALIELGATVCTPASPDCPRCPLGQSCLSLKHGTVSQRPTVAERAETPVREMGAAFAERDGRLLVVRRVPRGLLGGLWELPATEVEGDESAREALSRRLRGNLGLAVSVDEELAVIRHAYTHFRVVVHAYRCQVQGEPTPSGPWNAAQWLAPHEQEAFGLTGITRKLLSRLARGGSEP